MGRLQHLTSLYVEFENILLDWPPSPAGPAFAGLAASSKLVSLIMYEPKFPRDVWPHVFPATHTLPHLTCLRASANEWGAPAVPGAWGAADVSSLVSCCPNLCEIEDWTLQHGSHVSELRKLTALTNMYVVWSVDSVSAFEESLKGLAALTQLEVLHVGLDSQELSVTSLLPLTSLTALKSLFRRDGISSSSPWELNLASTQDTSAPDVWLQLLERCAAEPGCQPIVLRSLAQRLAQQEVLNAQRQQQIIVLQDRLSAQQKQVAEEHALTAQQLTEQRALIEELQQQVAGLSKQMLAQ